MLANAEDEVEVLTGFLFFINLNSNVMRELLGSQV